MTREELLSDWSLGEVLDLFTVMSGLPKEAITGFVVVLQVRGSYAFISDPEATGDPVQMLARLTHSAAIIAQDILEQEKPGDPDGQR